MSPAHELVQNHIGELISGHCDAAARSINAGELGSNAHADLILWYIFEIGGNQVLLPLLVMTFLLSRKLVRHPAMINVCCTCILSGIISSLLLYSRQQYGPEPDKTLCIVQATLIAPVPPMVSTAVLALVYHTWSTFRPFKRTPFPVAPKQSRAVTFALLAAPYVAHLGFAAVALYASLENPGRVTRGRRFFYCSVQFRPFSISLCAYTAVICLVATMLEVHLIVMLSRHRKALRNAGLRSGIDTQLIVRVGIFVAYVFCGTVVEVINAFGTQTVLPDMFAASVGTAFFLVFATQPRGLSNATSSSFGTTSPIRVSASLSIDFDPFERQDSEEDEKTRVDAAHAYYTSRVLNEGAGVEVIKRPEDAFIADREPRRAWGIVGDYGVGWTNYRPTI
ncbi:hypothetical protein GY45DRAFT_1366451 [Cubamyces sp. BRFM 1775]|nr:hypothetical protein GY45DRAFT_1366451 [Cubamyces sp. BRFM 1775]